MIEYHKTVHQCRWHPTKEVMEGHPYVARGRPRHLAIFVYCRLLNSLPFHLCFSLEESFGDSYFLFSYNGDHSLQKIH
jgi:hypothetical protein